MKGVGFEPTPTKSLVPEHGPLTNQSFCLYIVTSIRACRLVILTTCVQNSSSNSFFSNVNKMTGVGLEPMQPKCLVPKTSALEHSAILPVYCDINVIHQGSRY